MVRKLGRVAAGLVAGVGMAVLSAGVLTADDKGEKVPSIEEIMKKGHQGSKSLLKGIAAQAKEGKWEDALNGAKTLKMFGESLGKNKPDKGSPESWKKLTDKYKKNTEAVYKAVEKKDVKEVTDALGKVTGAKGANCMECHKAHKGD
jgi:cytochrome c556